jgi:hypothetical protein
MPFNIGLLSDAALTGLSDADKESMQKQATQQFLLGSLLSGDPATGFKSASEIPATAISMQDMLRKSQLAQADQAALEGFRARYTPTRFQEANPAYMGPVMPEQLAQQEQIKGARAQGLPFNIQNALQDVLGLPVASQSAMRETITALQPKVQGDLMLNPNMQIIGGLPTSKDQIQTQFNTQTGQFEAKPVFGGMQARIQTTPPEVSANTMLVPLQGGGFVQRAIPGGPAAVGEIESAKAIAQASGQVERVVGADGTEYFVPRSALLTQRPTAGQAGVTTGGASIGAVAKASPAQQTLDAATNARFLDFSKNSLESANSASGRKIAAEQLYDLATQVNNNKLTGLQAGVYGYMNAIPGVGKLFEQDITDVTRMTQMIKTAQLEKTAMQKGAASNLDATTIEKSYASITDPASSTRMAAAFEVALADKDVAKNQFVEAYRGDPGKINTAWQSSPDNKPVFSHPKFNQFLTEQVNAWNQGGAQGKPVLPAGFQFGTGKKSGEFQIKRPDGSIYRIGQ